MSKLIQKQKIVILVMLLLLLPAIMARANVCEIVGDKEYADLSDALKAVKNNQTIKLLQNINYYNDQLAIHIYDKSITFDLNGFNLNVEAGLPLQVSNGGEVKLTGKGEFNVTSNGLPGTTGVSVSNGGKATVTNATGSYSGVSARNNANVTILGNATATNNDGSGVDADNSIVTVYGNVIGYIRGVHARSNANVIVNGDITSMDTGIGSFSGSSVTVTGTVTGRSTGIQANGGKVSVLSGAKGDDCGVSAHNAIISVSGSISGNVGIIANGGSKVSVTGSVTGGSGRSFGPFASGFGVLASDNNTTVAVSGDVTGHTGVLSSNGSSVTVTGDVIADISYTGDINSMGVQASESATVTIFGNVSGNHGVWIQNKDAIVTIGGDVLAERGVYISENCNARITIDGQMKVTENGWFIGIITPGTQSGFYEFTPADYQPTSTKSGYREYTDGKNYVWVKGEIDTGIDIIPQRSSTLKASIQNGRLHVSGLTVGEVWTVYNVSGVIVSQNRATAEEAVINLPSKGIYIIVSAGKSIKVGNF